MEKFNILIKITDYGKLHNIFENSTSSFGPTIKHVPSRLEKALTACSGIIYVTKANPFNFLVKESMGRCVSVNGPITNKLWNSLNTYSETLNKTLSCIN